MFDETNDQDVVAFEIDGLVTNDPAKIEKILNTKSLREKAFPVLRITMKSMHNIFGGTKYIPFIEGPKIELVETKDVEKC